MFTAHFSNQIAHLKDLLAGILEQDPNPNPFVEEIVLVQSQGMAQWLQMALAEQIGVAGNIAFPYPTSFLWQQYRTLFPELPKENLFERTSMVWRLMRLIPRFLQEPEFEPLASYLQKNDQLKLYQLAVKVADLFDQYLVYRPHWLVQWETGQLAQMQAEILVHPQAKRNQQTEITASIAWQSRLWNALVADIKQDSDEVIFNTSHRAYLQERYFAKLNNLTEVERALLPQRIFVFGISSLPMSQLAVLQKLSEHCQVHLFFTNPSESYWGDDREERAVEKLALQQNLSPEELAALTAEQGNPLLTTWGKQGKEFLKLITELEPQDISYYDHFEQENPSLLTQVKQAILQAEPESHFDWQKGDRSIQIHSCHSPMREVEVLHNQLLGLFEQDPDLSPKDIIVMSADIDKYAPYINAVFSRYDYQDPRYIPFALSDQKRSQTDPIVASFLTLLSIKDRKLTAEEVLDLFDIHAIRERFSLSSEQILILREWVKNVGIRAGLHIDNPDWQNYNSWENGLNRLLLGTSLKAENHSWQETLAFDESYGLSAELTGQLAKFIENLTAWAHFIREPQSASAWQGQLASLISDFYWEGPESVDSLLVLNQAVSEICEQIAQTNYDEEIGIEVMAPLFEQHLSEQRSHLNFLVGKVNFCTLLPMRAIPFKVVCLLGMNEGEFPRQQTINSFDLMQYAPTKGDRAKRDDDRYLFLEALLSAQNILYISYLDQSLTSSDKKLPSVLVSQLLDYLTQYHEEIKLIEEHAMTVFSPHNFGEGKYAYDKEWLQVKNQVAEVQPFLTKLDQEEMVYPIEIELNDLIAYLREPLKFFFNRQLGIYFEQYDEAIEESEHFDLDALDRYSLLDALLPISQEQEEIFFEQEKLKGKLPANYFATIAQEKLRAEVEGLRSILSPYFQQESEILPLQFETEIKQGKVHLMGNLPNYFNGEIIQWRVGGLRDKEIIQTWIYTLLLAVNEQSVPIKFYYRSGSEAKYLTFKVIDKQIATELLTCYIQDYLTSQSELKWAVTYQLTDYFNPKKRQETSDQEWCRTAVILQQEKDRTSGPYLARLMVQLPEFDWVDIHQRTSDWFELMIGAIQEQE